MNLKQENYLKWHDEGQDTWSAGLCSVNLRVTNASYDVCLPSGQHRRGTAESADAAKQEAFLVFADFALKQLAMHAVALPVHAAA